MKSAAYNDKITANFDTQPVRWADAAEGFFHVKISAADSGVGQAWRKAFRQAGIEPSALYFKNGVKVAEQFRLQRMTWAHVFKKAKSLS